MASDLLVSDHSSIAFEFMLLDRPIVVVDRPELIRQAAINPQKVELLRSASSVVRSATRIAPAVQEALGHPDRLGPQRRRIASSLFHRPGTATDRAVALVYRLLGMQAQAADGVRQGSAVLQAAG